MLDNHSLLTVGRSSIDLAAPMLIVSAKLTAPLPPALLLPRPRLLGRLGTGAGRKLTLLVAPVGYGKTTLLAEWLDQQLKGQGEEYNENNRFATASPVVLSPSFAWLTLDSNDNDPHRFWTYLIRAIEETHPHIASMLQPFLAVDPLPHEQLVATLNNLLASSERRLVIILDEYHTITNGTIHRSINALLEHLPSLAHLVIASRVMPPLPLALLRARNNILELNASDLSFSPSEIASLANDLLELDLAPDDLAMLEKRSEGWAAGLHLIALALRNAPMNRWLPLAQQRSLVLHQMTGSHHYLADYFFEEVFARQSPDVQTFLLYTSILERLSAPLCDSFFVDQTASQSALIVRPLPSAQVVLERSDLFLIPLDGERHWYRYHPLFREMLRERLERTAPQMLAALHRRAAAWYEAQGKASAAVDHALAIGDNQWVARLIETSARTSIMRGEMRTLRRWLAALDEGLIRSRPQLTLLQAWASLFAGDLDRAKVWLEDARATSLSNIPESDPFRYEVLAVSTIIMALEGDVDGAQRQAQEALAHLSGNEAFLRSIFTMALSMSALMRGNLDEANRIFSDVIATGKSAGNVFVAIAGLSHLAEHHRHVGQLVRARALFEQVAPLAVDEENQPLPIAGALYIGLGDLLREQNEVTEAEQALLNGIELSANFDDHMLFEGYISLSRLYEARGDLRGAQQAVWRARSVAPHKCTPLDETLLAVREAELALAEGDLVSAIQWVKESQRDKREEGAIVLHSCHSRVVVGTVAVRTLLSEQRYDEALLMLSELLEETKQQQWLADLVTLLALLAVAHYALDDMPAAVATLERALVLAAPAGYIRTLLDLGPSFVELLRAVQLLGVEGLPAGSSLPLGYVERLLAAAPPSLEEKAPLPQQPSAHGLLSEREQTILGRMAAGLSNTAIAAELVVAPSTVKTHVKNIFAKLDVHNRVQAIARAQELRLIHS